MIVKRKGFYIYGCRECGATCKNKDEPMRINGKEVCNDCWYRLYDPQSDPTS